MRNIKDEVSFPESELMFSSKMGTQFPIEFFYKLKRSDGQNLGYRFVQVGKMTNDHENDSPTILVHDEENGGVKIHESKTVYIYNYHLLIFGVKIL